MARVAVLDDWQGVAPQIADWSRLQAQAEVVFVRDAFADGDAAVVALAGFDIILAMRERTRLDRSVIDRLPALRLLAFTGPRNAAVDVPACTARGITVCNTQPTGQGGFDTSELALGLLLAAARHLPLGDAEIRAGRFQQNMRSGIGLEGRTLGVIGLGRLGGRMAQYGLALGMQVQAWSTNLTDAQASAGGVVRAEKDVLMSTSDAISLHLVLSERTRGIIGAADIARMKPGAILVNTSRGPLVDETALLAALGAGKIQAAIDVYDREPLPADHPLRRAPNTVLSPHVGYVTADNMAALYRMSIENISAYLAGTPIRVVNPPA